MVRAVLISGANIDVFESREDIETHERTDIS